MSCASRSESRRLLQSSYQNRKRQDVGNRDETNDSIRYYFLFFSLLVTALFASQIPKTVLDTSTLGFYHKDDPTRVTYESFKEQFGLDEVVVISITPSNIYDLGFLRKLKRFHKELEAKVPYLDEVKSLINVVIHGKGLNKKPMVDCICSSIFYGFGCCRDE